MLNSILKIVQKLLDQWAQKTHPSDNLLRMLAKGELDEVRPRGPVQMLSEHVLTCAQCYQKAIDLGST